MKHILSLGAGVQSSTMALMAAAGVITPMPECAIFADTQGEPPSVYEWLDWLEKQLPFPVHRVTKGSLAADSTRLRISRGGKAYQKSSPPAFTAEAGKPTGLLMRQCTQDYKLDPIFRKMRNLGGKASGVTQWVGISTDEVQRARPVHKKNAKWLTNRWPLIEMRMSRMHCIEWLKAKGLPIPPRSACSFCPYHTNEEWRRLIAEEPGEFEKAVAYERALQATFAQVVGFRGTVFLHRDLVPLDQVDLAKPSENMEMFDEHGFAVECEGMCGL